MRAKSSRGTGPPCPGTEMFATFLARNGGGEPARRGKSICSPGASPVNRSVSPDDDADRTTSDGYGPSSEELFACFVPDSSSLKMFPDFCPQAAMDTAIAAYAAGLVDGDGSIWIQKGRKQQVYPAVSIRLGWKGKSTLEMLQSHFGGSIAAERREPNPKHAEVYRWGLVGGPAAEMLKTIYPFLRIKRAQAATALHCWAIWQQKTETRFKECSRLKALMGILNQTGPEFVLPVVGLWLLVPDDGEGNSSLKWSETFPASGILSSGRVSRRRPLVRRTSGGECSLWHTPNVPNGGRVNPEDMTPTVRLASGKKRQVGLECQVRMVERNLWPTPTTVDSVSGRINKSPSPGAAERPTLALAVKMWPTPTQADGLGGPGNSGRQGGENLRTAAARWPTPKASAENYGRPLADDRGDLQAAVLRVPTPSARDWKSSHASEATLSKNSRPLNEVVSGGSGGQLNPDWVDWLIGAPIGWTACEGPAMLSCPLAPNSSEDES